MKTHFGRSQFFIRVNLVLDKNKTLSSYDIFIPICYKNVILVLFLSGAKLTHTKIAKDHSLLYFNLSSFSVCLIVN